MVDSGVTTSLIHLEMVERLGLLNEVKEGVDYELAGAFDGSNSLPHGEVMLDFNIGRQSFTWNFTVANLANKHTLILGQDFWQDQNTVLKNNFGDFAFFLNNKRIEVTTDLGQVWPLGQKRLTRQPSRGQYT